MIIVRLIRLVVVIGLTLYGIRWFNDPLRTRLPFGSTDLSSVQIQLARLPVEERGLVQAYVARSRGDVLPERLADPVEPLTARTFGQAIELQRHWQVTLAQQEALAARRRALIESRVAALRMAVATSVLEASIRSSDEFEPVHPPGTRRRVGDAHPVFVVKLRVENRAEDTIVSMNGSMKALDRQSPLPLNLCWVDLRRPLAPGAFVDVTCMERYRHPTEQEQDFAAGDDDRFDAQWWPSAIQFDDGREMTSG